jgi:hypothetical protein
MPAAGPTGPGLTVGAVPPGWYHAGDQTLRYWDGHGWTKFVASWNGTRWVRATT